MALTTRISELPAKGSTVANTDLIPIAEVDATTTSGYRTKYITGAELPGGGGGNTIYTADDTIVGVRTVDIGTSLAFQGGKLDRTLANSRNIVEVIRASDLPTTLVANTTYIIRGSITFSQQITVSASGCEIIGLDRTADQMIWDSTGSFIRVNDVDFTIKNLRMSSNQTSSSLIRATNYTLGVSANNYGRTKVLQIFGCDICRAPAGALQISRFCSSQY